MFTYPNVTSKCLFGSNFLILIQQKYYLSVLSYCQPGSLGTFPGFRAYIGMNGCFNATGGFAMFCPKCGKEYTERVNYCCQCGTSLSGRPTPPKKLTRSIKDKKIAGVCGGLA